MSARALTRSRHFRERAQAERLDSIETRAGKGWAMRQSGDETSVSEQKGVMQWTGIKFGA